jgi:putative NADH-flavin reductase
MRPIVKLLVLGATGKTGQQIVTQALDAGHTVTIVARDRSKVSPEHPRQQVVIGDAAAGAAALAEAMRDQDAVISAIGRGHSFKSEHLIARSVPGIIAAMQAAGVRRLMFTSALGVGHSFADAPLAAKIFFLTLLRGIYADKLVGDRLIRDSDLEWTIVQPSQFNDGPLTKTYRSGERLAMSGMPQISRADTAHFILDRINDPLTIRKTLIVST